uniref:Uncharacterized protein n=1 Tax=Anopheles atroparvus TaxID=41427 RepID=A0AAG5DSV9_ANOAO
MVLLLPSTFSLQMWLHKSRLHYMSPTLTTSLFSRKYSTVLRGCHWLSGKYHQVNWEPFGWLVDQSIPDMDIPTPIDISSASILLPLNRPQWKPFLKFNFKETSFNWICSRGSSSPSATP